MALIPISLKVNGTRLERAVEPRRLLADFLREDLDLKATHAEGSTVVQVLYTGRDPFAQKVFVSRGREAGLVPGSAVIDEHGVVGQLTRVHPQNYVDAILGIRPPEGELRKVSVRYRCSNCGTELRMTLAPGPAP